jgi:anti-sigma factor RsiW
MACKETERFLGAYVDGEMDVAGSLAVEKHVLECASCSKGITSLRSLALAIRTRALRFEAPPRLKKNVRGAIRERNPE